MDAKFRYWHSVNIELWRGRWDETWPGSAKRGPWRGIAEDLANESNNRPTLPGERSKTF